MRLRRLMGVADQIVASRFSSIDLSNKADYQCKHLTVTNALVKCSSVTCLNEVKHVRK
ncbi:hypothetical protein [Enterovibrio nigricans]|uniref:hypothetical protein n=1 Tax=Enterovibrio nigricans TaxID=504469 RepID=UPI00148220CB|nr:hypothetical protein [Enterovibrio nigricans]